MGEMVGSSEMGQGPLNPILFSLSRNCPICEVRIASSFLEKLIGLMFKKDFKGCLLIRFNRRGRRVNSVHTFFMRFPIDLFFLLDMNVVEIRRGIRPWRVVSPSEPCDSVIESRCNSLDLKVGERLAVLYP